LINFAEVDLEDTSSSFVIPSDRPTRVIVRAGPTVLGIAKLARIRPSEVAAVQMELVEQFADRLYAREHMRAISSSSPVRPRDITVVVRIDDPIPGGSVEACLASVRDLEPQPGDVVVAGCDDDTTMDIASSFGVRHIGRPNSGLNRSWRDSETEVIAFIRAGHLIQRNYVQAVADGFVADEIAAVAGLVIPVEIRARPQAALDDYLDRLGRSFHGLWLDGRASSVGYEVFRLGGAEQIAFRRAALERVGGFDERFAASHLVRDAMELDVLSRVFRDGLIVRYEPKAVIRSMHPLDRTGALRAAARNGAAIAAFLAKAGDGASEYARGARAFSKRWRLGRHIRGSIGAIRHADMWRLQMTLAEAYGAAQGRKAYRRLTT
jgi:hypothetical protein